MIMSAAGFFSSLSPDIGIDLGTAATPVMECGRGITLREPSYVAFDRLSDSLVAYGAKAKQMKGRVPSNIEVIRPVRKGVVADYKACEAMLRCLISRTRRGLLGPRIMVGVPVDVTDVERKAVSEAVKSAGARSVYVVPQPLAAAVGCGLPVMEAHGTMIVDIGGGTSQAAVMSMGGIIVSDSIRVAGDSFDEALADYLRREHDLLVGNSIAERIKIEAGAAVLGEDAETNAAGRDIKTGLPRKVKLTSDEICRAFSGVLEEIANLVKRVLENTPPEFADDIVEYGISLSGGSSLLRGIDKYLTKRTGVYCQVSEDPLSSVAYGVEKMFGDPRLMRSLFGSAHIAARS